MLYNPGPWIFLFDMGLYLVDHDSFDRDLFSAQPRVRGIEEKLLKFWDINRPWQTTFAADSSSLYGFKAKFPKIKT